MYVHPFHAELNDLIKKLDAAADTAAKSVPTFTPDRKQRVESAVPSILPPPADAPDWALKPEFRKGIIQTNLFMEVDVSFYCCRS